MRELYGQCHGSTVLLHGGAGTRDPKSSEAVIAATSALKIFGDEAIRALAQGSDPFDVLVTALKRMEDDPQFNAGYGSALQGDGQARLTAAVMDGAAQSFSGVISCSYVRNPGVLARHLQTHESRVLTSPGAEMMARELHLPVQQNIAPQSLFRWKAANQEMKPLGDQGCDTVGCLIRTADGRVLVGTSTGGRGNEYPGRVSDSATVAGTYASALAGISATGRGEEIVDDAVAARIETRRRDGMTLTEACSRTFKEAVVRNRSYGWIAVDAEGHYGVAFTTSAMTFVVYDEASGLIQSS